jgi:hypothetical protein
VDGAGEVSDAGVFLAGLGGVLGLFEDALEIPPGLIVRSQKRLIPGQEKTAFARLEIARQAEKNFRLVGELEVVLDEAHELGFELLVRLAGSIETESQDAHDEEGAEKNPPE